MVKNHWNRRKAFGETADVVRVRVSRRTVAGDGAASGRGDFHIWVKIRAIWSVLIDSGM
jgi:hypothetical protein